MSLFYLLLTTIACMMLGNQMLANNPSTAPIAVICTNEVASCRTEEMTGWR